MAKRLKKVEINKIMIKVIVMDKIKKNSSLG